MQGNNWEVLHTSTGLQTQLTPSCMDLTVYKSAYIFRMMDIWIALKCTMVEKSLHILCDDE